MSKTNSGQPDLESQLNKSFLALERIDDNMFRANLKNLWQNPFGRFVFGGQVVGQALVAACETVTDDQHIQSSLLLLTGRYADNPDKEREFILRMLSCDIPVDIRPVNPEGYFRLRSSEPIRCVWLKAGHIGDDNKVHQCVSAYQSDYSLLGVALQPGGKNYEMTFMTSLDHTIWFHVPFRVDEWMLYEIFSPQCGSGRAVCHGRVWKRDGTLVMSIAQEGLVRNKPVDTVSKL